jgi:hypothetical protein
MNTYYRLFDKQSGGYMFTGYNSTTKNELIEEFISYKSNDLEDDELDKFNYLNKTNKLKFIESCDFIIEKSNKKFEDIDYIT